MPDAVADLQPDWVLNAGAYTAVDKAESNAPSPCRQRRGTRSLRIRVGETGRAHASTKHDYVFSGAQGSPYSVQQKRNPIGVYGTTKAAGEVAVQELLGDQGRGFLLRTSWVAGLWARTSR